jgi:hypothetical protein
MGTWEPTNREPGNLGTYVRPFNNPARFLVAPLVPGTDCRVEPYSVLVYSVLVYSV